jgi:transcriptional regulator with XRE-family HTH domain
MDDWEAFKKKSDALLPKGNSEIIDALSELYTRRIQSGISQRELAHRMGVTTKKLAKIEQLDVLPSFQTLVSYAAGLELKLTIKIASASD